MNFNRLSGIFIAVTLFIWILIFGFLPQQKYQAVKEISIPSPPKPVGLVSKLEEVELYTLKQKNSPINIKDSIPSAKEEVEKADLNLYVYKVGAFKSPGKIRKLIQSYKDVGFPSFTEKNRSDNGLTDVLVGPFASKEDIQKNEKEFNLIAGINSGEVLTWNL
jgi:ABC-type antimicrobial peptide transport system permease subunit